MSEVKKHNKDGDAWAVVHGNVVNVSDFLPQHPGGKAVLQQYVGKVRPPHRTAQPTSMAPALSQDDFICLCCTHNALQCLTSMWVGGLHHLTFKNVATFSEVLPGCL